MSCSTPPAPVSSTSAPGPSRTGWAASPAPPRSNGTPTRRRAQMKISRPVEAGREPAIGGALPLP